MRKNRKNEIYEIAMRLFQEKGYETVTVVDICEACGITKKAFYYHYASKDELLSQYFTLLCDDFDWEALKEEEQKPDANYIELLWKYEGYVVDGTIRLGSGLGQALHQYDISHNLNIYSPYTEGPHRLQSNQDEYIAMLKRGQQAGQIRSDRSAQDLLFFLFSAAIGLGSHWRSTNGAYDLKSEIRRIFDFVMLPPEA